MGLQIFAVVSQRLGMEKATLAKSTFSLTGTVALSSSVAAVQETQSYFERGDSIRFARTRTLSSRVVEVLASPNAGDAS
jgi:hypothetical protein